jgi:hypothetical protein
MQSIKFISEVKSSVMSASFEAWSGDLETIERSTSLLPRGMQTPVTSIETNRGRSTWLWGMPFLTVVAGPPVLLGKRSVR